MNIVGIINEEISVFFERKEEDPEFERQFQKHQMEKKRSTQDGTLISQTVNKEVEDYYDENNYETVPVSVNIFKNPKSLGNFSPRVRAVSDGAGNLFVAQTDEDFLHQHLNSTVWKAQEKGSLMGLSFYRINNSDVFALDNSGKWDYSDKYGGDRMDNMRNALIQLNKKHSQFAFLPLEAYELWENKPSQGEIRQAKENVGVNRELSIEKTAPKERINYVNVNLSYGNYFEVPEGEVYDIQKEIQRPEYNELNKIIKNGLKSNKLSTISDVMEYAKEGVERFKEPEFNEKWQRRYNILVNLQKKVFDYYRTKGYSVD